MKVVLAGPDREENLSLRYLASSLAEAGHHAILVPFDGPEDASHVVAEALRADMVGLSMCFQVRAREFVDVARAVKAEDRTKAVIAGGHFASCAAAPLLTSTPEIDLVAIHEGERTIVEIARAVESGDLAGRAGGIPGIAIRDGGEVRMTVPRPAEGDLDRLPWPDRSGPARLLAGVPTAYLMGSRGCFGSCDYCCITTLHALVPGGRFRQRRPERVADEMASLYWGRGVRLFVFHDDNFLVPSERRNHERLDALERALGERGVRDIGLTLKCRPGDATRSIMERLRDMGLVRVFLGVESATEAGLESLGRKQSAEESERALAVMEDLGISAQFTIMTLHPEATIGTVRSDVAFMRGHASSPLNWCRAEAYAGTPLERRMLEAGRARGSWLARTYGIADPAADLVSSVATRLFRDRCWSAGSLMERTIGTDHLAAVAREFYEGREVPDLGRDVASWVRRANEDTIDLLEAVVDACAGGGDLSDPGLQRAIREIAAREASSRAVLHAEGAALRDRLDGIVADAVGLDRPARPAEAMVAAEARSVRIARHAAAVILSLAVASSSCCRKGQGCGGVCEYAPPPMEGGGMGVCEYAAPPLPDDAADDSIAEPGEPDASGDAMQADVPADVSVEAMDALPDAKPKKKKPDNYPGVCEYAAEPLGDNAGILKILSQTNDTKAIGKVETDGSEKKK